MSHESKVFHLLQKLGARENWQIQSLPDDIDPAILATLDARGFVEIDLRRWHREPDDAGGTRDRCFTNRGLWFSPAERPEVAGNIVDICRNPFIDDTAACVYGAAGPCFEDDTTIRLTFLGRSELERLNIVHRDIALTENDEAGVNSRPGADAKDDSYQAVSSLAEHFVVSLSPLRKRLERFRGVPGNANSWYENANPQTHQPRYLYKVSAVMPEITALQSKQASVKCQSTNK